MTGGLSSPTNVVRLDTVADSKITGISLYSSRVEVTRVYRFSVAQDVNKVVISSLPALMDEDSLRISGKGSGTIHDVSVGLRPNWNDTKTSERLTSLKSQKEDLERSVERCKKCLNGLAEYLKTLDARHIEVTKLTEIVEGYESATAKFEARLRALEKELQSVKGEVDAEAARLTLDHRKIIELRKEASVTFVVEKPGDVEVQLVYVVAGARWHATYDIRVGTESASPSIQLCYKAVIWQNTGESWTSVPLTLHTASPTFGLDLPKLTPWTVSIFKERPEMRMLARKSTAPMIDEEREESDDDMGFGLFDDGPDDFVFASAQVTSKGNVSATFRVPGLITVLSDAENHSVTIQNLDLTAKLSWLSVPKKDSRVNLTAKINNTSDYTLIPGKTNVYVDGSFISSINLPLVTAGETFECPLGLDQTVRIIYHPRASKASQSGFYNKVTTTSFTQRISIHNTKSTPLGELTILDQVPVSEDNQVTVALKIPGLRLPDPEHEDSHNVGDGAENNAQAPVKVAERVQASWHDMHDTGDIGAVGKDGILKWVCEVPPKKKVGLVMQWDVVAPAQATVTNLNDEG